MGNKGIIFSGVGDLKCETIACDFLGNKYLKIEITTLPIQNEELLRAIFKYIKENEDFKVTIQKLGGDE